MSKIITHNQTLSSGDYQCYSLEALTASDPEHLTFFEMELRCDEGDTCIVAHCWDTSQGYIYPADESLYKQFTAAIDERKEVIHLPSMAAGLNWNDPESWSVSDLVNMINEVGYKWRLFSCLEDKLIEAGLIEVKHA